MSTEPIKDLLYKMADDQLIIGHRNSEWTGIGPILEEDIAFSSMAQDKIGQSYTLYSILNELGESDPDTIAFTRNAKQFHNCQFVEIPIGEYDFSLIRHFLFDFSEQLRFEFLGTSSYEPLAQVARKFSGEIRYHTMHARSFIKNLGNSSGESYGRLQESLNRAMPYALGIFEKSTFEEELISEKVWVGEDYLREAWLDSIQRMIKDTSLTLPPIEKMEPINGGRFGLHTPDLQPLLEEMSEVFRQDPTAEW